MPHLSKAVLSRFIGSECLRQLRLSLSPDNARYRHEREADGMPPPATPRPGLEQITGAGEVWQSAKLEDLRAAFGASKVAGAARTVQDRVVYDPTPLGALLASTTAPAFVAESEFTVGGSFVRAMESEALCAARRLDFATLRPDLIELIPAGRATQCIDARGDLHPLAFYDPRVALRVIDIKLTAEANAGYFTEVTYYAMALAGWLDDQGLSGRYVVVPEAAVWPGSHEASKLTKERVRLAKSGDPSTWEGLRAAMEGDLEVVPFEAFAYRIRRFFSEDLPRALATPWRELPWHVDNRCRHCDWLGFPWRGEESVGTSDPDQCYPQATFSSHLSRVAFLTRGARSALHAAGVTDVEELAARSPDDPVFETHHLLRATRSVLAGRARALETGAAEVPPGAGTSAMLPRWADLKVYVSADFDPGSSVTLAFAFRARHVEHREYGDTNPAPRAAKDWEPEVFLVDQKDLAVERRELFSFLDRLRAVLEEAQASHAKTTFQLYLWDTLTYKHLCRVVGRHLDAILMQRSLSHLAWLFPPETVLQDHEAASRRAPIAVVKEAIRCVLAAPIAHYYNLLGVARSYHPASLPAPVARFHVHPLFEDPLSDQIPPERAHEIWTRSNHRTPWLQQAATLQETVTRRLGALEAVTDRLTEDLRPLLGNTAPVVRVGPPKTIERLSPDSQLWYGYARLGEALDELEVHQIRAMPAAEREARFKSARLVRQLTGAELHEATTALGLYPSTHRRVYELAPGSTQVSVKERDFQLALAPEDAPGLLDQSLSWFVKSRLPGVPTEQRWASMTVADLTGVSVAAIDRERRLIALDLQPRWSALLAKAEAAGVIDLSKRVILDPTHRAFFSSKLRKSLDAIGVPARSVASSTVLRAMGASAPTPRKRPSRDTPVAEVIWSAKTLQETPVARDVASTRAALEAGGVSLNPSQWTAWEASLTRRAQLVWGPPGTGKSATLRAIVLGALRDAHDRGVSLRVLIAAPTYLAFDNVLLDVLTALPRFVPADAVLVRRLRSSSAALPVAELTDVDLVTESSPATGALRQRLSARQGLTLVAATVEQTQKLAMLDEGDAVTPWFDLVVIDEASQMDVAHAIVALSCLAEGGSVVVAGDPKQLPPIHPAEPPVGIEAMVGSIYDYLADLQGVASVMLEENYRSNAEVVGFTRRAGYRDTLRANSPKLSLDLLDALPTERPIDWPDTLPWCEGWSRLLDPARPTVCFVYPDERSSQWNRFEADAVASMLRLLYGRMAGGLVNERTGPSGAVRPRTTSAYDATGFWRRGVGVVTPHRAQQGLIVRRLQSVFTPLEGPHDQVRAAVDTVERFQGQQRDVIVASFALGDPDMVGDEEEFLLGLERFNVMVSRARVKAIVLISETVVRHLAEDLDVLRGSQLLKGYVESWCDARETLTLAVREGDADVPVKGTLRWRGGDRSGG